MTRDETVALFLECEAKRGEARAAALAQGKSENEARNIAHEAAKAHWNAWAEPLLAGRKAMEADGRWATEKDILGRLAPSNAETRAWMEKAAAFFSRCLFLVRGVKGTKETAGEEEKENAGGSPPVKSIQLEGDRADLSGYIFPGDAGFKSATFTSTADFNSATFTVSAWFERATFTGTARFRSATFTGTAGFASATFTGNAWFESATFTGTAGFRSATFTDYATFGSATFSGTAGFESATFKNSTTFGQAKFQKQASFTGIKVERAFDMTGAAFAQVPAFNQADFKQAPDLDDVEFPLPGYWRRGDPTLIPQYRAIRRMAIQGADYEREQMAFKGEIRCKRGTEHKPWHTAFWFGIAYDAFSDFGRSIARPLGIWLASAIAFAAIYAWDAGVAVSDWVSACADDGAPKVLKALTLSAANSLPLLGSSRGEVAADFYKCLALPHVPAWSPLLQIGQTLWSAVLLFLFLLALRNQFKIK